MSRHKRRAGKGRQAQTHLPVPDQRRMGLQALQAGRFDNAIAAWSGLPQRDAQVTAALAEAHFRRALTRPAGQEQVADLWRAVALAPAELRYQYHLGLALHRAGDRAAAVQRYRTVLQHDAAWPGAGMALALTELEQEPQVDLAALPGSTPAIPSRPMSTSSRSTWRASPLSSANWSALGACWSRCSRWPPTSRAPTCR